MAPVKEYQNVTEELISKSFPLLKRNNIRVFELKFTNLYGIYIPFIDRIGINKFCKNFSKKEVRAILAHELCHAELSKKYGFLKTLKIFTLYWFFPEIRRKEEIKTDKLVIKKRYAKDLVLLHKRLEKDYPELKDKTYMSVKKVKSYAKFITR